MLVILSADPQPIVCGSRQGTITVQGLPIRQTLQNRHGIAR